MNSDATRSSATMSGRGLTLAAAVEPHAHLDKAFLADVIDNPRGDLVGAIESMGAARDRLNVDETIERAERAVRRMHANGYRAVRSHADVTSGNGLVGVTALAEVRRTMADLIDLQIVALAGQPVCGAAGAETRALLVDALDAGADLVGGCPHLEPDSPSAAATDVLLGIAADRCCAVDLHTDETLDPLADGLGELAAFVIRTGFEHAVTASHCVSLAMRPEADQIRIAERVAEARIGVIALPATNLFLQGRSQQQAMPRGVTAVKALRAAGVRVAAGADNVQDPFNPIGRLSPFETAGLMILTAHLLPDDAWASVSTIAADVCGFDLGGATVEVDASSTREAIANG